MRFREIITEQYDTSKARIDHPEDMVFSRGTAGAKIAVELLSSAVTNSERVSIKPDGKPAIKWGRDASGFCMGDKYMNPLPHSLGELENYLSLRKTGSKQYLLKLYTHLWPIFEASVPGINGYLFGDLMWYKKPSVQNGEFVIQPNTVTYTVPVNSQLGNRIQASQAGIVVHTYLPPQNSIGQHIENVNMINGVDTSGALAILDDSLGDVGQIQSPDFNAVLSVISKYGNAADEFLNEVTLSQMKIKALPGLLKKYVNSILSKQEQASPQGFYNWLPESGSTPGMVQKVQSYTNDHPEGFQGVFAIFNAIVDAKMKIVEQFDQVGSNMTATINGQPGHEGYLVHSQYGPIKLINRYKFSAANNEKNNRK